jgi:hypothetical protein
MCGWISCGREQRISAFPQWVISRAHTGKPDSSHDTEVFVTKSGNEWIITAVVFAAAISAVLSLPMEVEGSDIGNPTVLVDGISVSIGMEREALLELFREKYDVSCYRGDDCIAAALIRRERGGRFENIASVNFSNNRMESIWVYWPEGNLAGDSTAFTETLFTLIEKVQNESYRSTGVEIEERRQPGVSQKIISLKYGRKTIEINQIKPKDDSVTYSSITEITQ